MSVLRRAKLRTPDGTESIEYPLGVDAENVEVANRENLSQRLARIDEDLEKNEEDIAAVSELAGTNKQNIGANEVRIDALERRSASVDKKPYYFDTVADMKAYQKLVEGDMAITLGYYEANDGGAGQYIVKKTSNKYTENLNNNLLAELIIKDKISVKQLGAYGDGNHDDSIPIKNAIMLSIKSSSTYNIKIPVIFSKGIFNIVSNCIFSDFDLTNLGFGIVEGLTFKGCGRENTILKLITNNTEKWFYNNNSINTQKTQRLNFIDLQFTTDNFTLGNGFAQYSKGGEKQFRFFRCRLELNKIIELNGTGNADLNRFINCGIAAHGDVITLNNPQSVSNIFQNTDISIRKNLVTVLEHGGGDLIFSNCNMEMHETNGTDENDYFLFNIPNEPSLSVGNCHYMINGTRFELHGSRKKLVKTVNNNFPVDISFENCWFGVDDGPERIVAEIYPSKILKFRNCSINDNFKFKVIGNYANSQSSSSAGTIIFDTCDVGRLKSLYNRIEIDSDFYRVKAEKCYKLSSTGQRQPTPQDFDYGWNTVGSYSIQPAKKLSSLKPNTTAFPIPSSTTYDLSTIIPPNVYITKIYIKRNKISGSSGNYQLHVGNEDKSIILGSSELSSFSSEHIINLDEIGFINFNTLKIWATGDAGTPTSNGCAYVEYI